MPGKNRAQRAAGETSIASLARQGHLDALALDEASCDDCGAALTDWIETLNGAILCFSCADVWEEVDEGVGA